MSLWDKVFRMINHDHLRLLILGLLLGTSAAPAQQNLVRQTLLSVPPVSSGLNVATIQEFQNLDRDRNGRHFIQSDLDQNGLIGFEEYVNRPGANAEIFKRIDLNQSKQVGRWNGCTL